MRGDHAHVHSKRWLLRTVKSTSVIAGLVLSTGLFGCSSATDPSHQPSLVRAMNVGLRDIEGLVVLFPNERVEFGDVAAGTTTQYLISSVGVYGYAAYEFLVGGVVKHQPVIDWVGEKPM